MSTGLEIPDFLVHLLNMYQEQQLGAMNEEPTPSHLEALHAKLDTAEEKEAASLAIQDFLDCSRDYLKDHPPQQHFMLSTGFGIELGGGVRVAIAAGDDLPAGSLEEATDVAVTMPRSIRGQHGISPSKEIAVTGIDPAMTVKRPA